MATSTIYGSENASGVNAYGFKAQPVQDDNPMANFLQSSENTLSARGSDNTSQGQADYSAGTHAMAPLLDYLTKLTKGDQADVAQATQSQTNQIKDSFAAARNMISGQARGGGKAGVLAEAPFKQAQAVGDMQSQARTAGAGQLGSVAAGLAGLGQGEQQLGLAQNSEALNAALGQRSQNVTERGQNKQLAASLAGTASSVLF
jgi:hypothetical protein